ncbi:MAG: peroxiredoxin [Clostridia bacterium]|nr:peroxiredoxin [Clostridia bacterium]
MDNICLRIGDIAPRFNATSTLGDIKLSDYLGKWLVLFSFHGAFTPICTTEIVAFSKANQEFNDRNCLLLGLSTDSNTTHMSWTNDIEKMTNMEVPFPIISDSNLKISKMYNMQADNNDTQTLRTIFILDPNQRIRLISMYPTEIGRNIYEILRCLQALQESDENNTIIPANWMPGNPTMYRAPKNYIELKERTNNPDYKCLDWYLCFNNRV